MAKSAKKTTTQNAAAKKTASKKTAPPKTAEKTAANKTTAEKTAAKKTVSRSGKKDKCAPTYEQVAARAFEIYADRAAHGKPGTPDGDWHEAERQLKAGC